MNALKLRNRLAQAIAAHQAGQYVEAEAAYRQLLQKAPDNASCLCMLGILECETGRLASGVAALERAVRLEPKEPTACINLANALAQLGRLAEAVRMYEHVLRLLPRDAEVYVQLGQVLVQGGAPERAIEHYRKAIRLRPDVAEWHELLGIAQRTAGDHEGAVAAYREAVKLAPRSARIHYHLGIALHAVGRIDESIAAFDTAAGIEPGNADIENNLGNVVRLSGNIDRALAVLERALKLHPRHPGIRVNLANTLVDHNRVEESLPHYEWAIAERPREADFHMYYGSALEALGRYEEAMEACRTTLELDPGHRDALFLLGLRSLALRDYAQGWKGYEYRWSGRKAALRLRRFARPRWNGEPLQGKRLLIHAEQGLGDEIMFASIFPEIIAEAAHCTIECAPKLEALFKHSFPAANIVPSPRKADWFDASPAALESAGEPDFQIPAGSLPSLRRCAAEAFPAHRGYLRANEESVARWRARLATLGPGLKVGLSWRGGTARSATRRSMEPMQLLPILDVPGCHFVSLQYTPCEDELAELKTRTGMLVHHWQDAIDDYSETAALVSALDVTISVCTAVVHLGGALGKPVWVMAPRFPEWRYAFAGEDMPWYPSVRVFRQEESRDWQALIGRIAVELRRYTNV